MAASKKKTEESPPLPKATAPSALAGSLRQAYRPVTLITAAVVVTAGLFLPRLKTYLPDLSERSEYLLSAKEIDVTQPPHWVPRDFVARVVEDANLPEKLPLLDNALVGDVAEAFRCNPWVEDVVSVSKSYPARV